MIDVLRDELLTLRQVAKRVGVAHQTVWNWVSIGYKGTKLDAVRLGAAWKTTEAALLAFVEAINQSPREQPAPRPVDNREKQARAAMQRLRAKGL